MIKKLFLFTFLTVSFLVISCNSNISPRSGIDSKYNGIYEGKRGTSECRLAIGSDAILSLLGKDDIGEGGFIARIDQTVNFGYARKSMIDKLSDTKFEASNVVNHQIYTLIFSDDGKTLIYMHPEDTLTLKRQ